MAFKSDQISIPNIQSDKLPILIKSLNSFLLYSLQFFWAPYFISIGLNGYQIGIIFAFYSISGLINTLPSGFINDRLNSKKLLQIAIIFLSIWIFFAGITENFYIILLSFIIGGIGNNLFKISIDSFFFKSKEVKKDSKKIGYYLAGNNIGYGLGVLLSGYLQSFLPYQKITTIISILLFINFFFTLFLTKKEVFKFKFIEYKKDIFKKEVLIFLLIFFLFALHFGSEYTTYGLFLEKILKLSKIEMGFYMGLTIVSMAIPSLIAAKKLKDGLKAINILYLGLLLSGLGYLISALPNLYISFTGRLIHETGDAIMFIFMYYGIIKLFVSERIGGNIGVITLVTVLGSSFGSLIFGPIGSKLSYELPIIITSFVILFCIPLTYHFKHLIKH